MCLKPLLLLLLIAVPLTAQTSKQAKKVRRAVMDQESATIVATASLQGDVYVLTQSGEVKKGAANTVYLVALPLKQSFRDQFDSLCVIHNATFRDWTKQNSERIIAAINSQKNSLIDATMASTLAHIDTVKQQQSEWRNRLVSYQSAFTSPTGVNAHYAFTNIPPGSYLLVASMSLLARYYEWYVPVTLSAGGLVTVDLDSNNMRVGESFACDSHEPITVR